MSDHAGFIALTWKAQTLWVRASAVVAVWKSASDRSTVATTGDSYSVEESPEEIAAQLDACKEEAHSPAVPGRDNRVSRALDHALSCEKVADHGFVRNSTLSGPQVFEWTRRNLREIISILREDKEGKE